MISEVNVDVEVDEGGSVPQSGLQVAGQFTATSDSEQRYEVNFWPTHSQLCSGSPSNLKFGLLVHPSWWNSTWETDWDSSSLGSSLDSSETGWDSSSTGSCLDSSETG
mmetsp:Transcript_11642/g.23996  ORF Transcript_11642/g.23996 Transcript_11642/m.23996 type:complete len:108 (+) Transcript_11642:70-393(+)